jgi:hypothetical protein
MRAPNLPVLFHPDCNRRLRNRTESADPADCSAGARGLWRSLAITAGGDFHPAPRTRSDPNPTDAINAPSSQAMQPFCVSRTVTRPRSSEAENAALLLRHRREDRFVEVETGVRWRVDGKIALDDLGAGIQRRQTRRHFAGNPPAKRMPTRAGEDLRDRRQGQPPAA